MPVSPGTALLTAFPIQYEEVKSILHLDNRASVAESYLATLALCHLLRMSRVDLMRVISQISPYAVDSAVGFYSPTVRGITLFRFGVANDNPRI